MIKEHYRSKESFSPMKERITAGNIKVLDFDLIKNTDNEFMKIQQLKTEAQLKKQLKIQIDNNMATFMKKRKTLGASKELVKKTDDWINSHQQSLELNLSPTTHFFKVDENRSVKNNSVLPRINV